MRKKALFGILAIIAWLVITIAIQKSAMAAAGGEKVMVSKDLEITLPLERSLSGNIAYYLANGFIDGKMFYFVTVTTGENMSFYQIPSEAILSIGCTDKALIRKYAATYTSGKKEYIEEKYEIEIPQSSIIYNFGVISDKKGLKDLFSLE